MDARRYASATRHCSAWLRDVVSGLLSNCTNEPRDLLGCRYMDGRRYASAGSHCKQGGGWQTSSAPGSCSGPFDRPFGLLLNVAVGGLLPGKAPRADTVFPQTMLVCSLQSIWIIVLA